MPPMKTLSKLTRLLATKSNDTKLKPKLQVAQQTKQKAQEGRSKSAVAKGKLGKGRKFSRKKMFLIMMTTVKNKGDSKDDNVDLNDVHGASGISIVESHSRSQKTTPKFMMAFKDVEETVTTYDGDTYPINRWILNSKKLPL
ncbi:hypothetical protein QE152_g32188 [Popillia japonica]|uniref:Uncharacterized protein n=1 Tax=Popillia japonica TaxID=7064 RepID=A0AAW1J0I8_POPJA